jgi:Family of unknown function (DUF6677)
MRRRKQRKVSHVAPGSKSHPSDGGNSVHPAALLALGWLLPGAGFLLLDKRYRSRAVLLIAVIHATFLIGVLLRGGVAWPIWSLSSPGFSVINNINFIFQFGAGWMSVFSMVATQMEWGALGALEVHPYSELGSFYCLVAGALNYFIVWQTLDRRRRKAFEFLAKQ